MTTTNANGIVFLEETDPISPFHTLINTLQQGTSNAISGLRPAWTTMTLAAQYSAVSGSPVQYRVVDGWCELRGLVNVASMIPTGSLGNFVNAGQAPGSIGGSQTVLLPTGGADGSGNLTGPVYLNPRSDGGIRIRAAVVNTFFFSVDGIRYRVS